MKRLLVGFAVLGYAAMFASVGGMAAPGGVGACVAGSGTDLQIYLDGAPFAGAVVGGTSGNNVYGDANSFESACCADGGQTPDCFQVVGGT